MSDITKCNGDDCPLKESCYRYTSLDGERQSYLSDIPYKGSDCEYFMDNGMREMIIDNVD